MKRNNMFKVTLTDLVIKDGFNIREDYGDIEQLASSIQSYGIKVPLSCYKENGKFVVVDGHRRIKALKYLQDNTECTDLEIPVMPRPKGDTDKDRTLDMLLFNEGKNLTLLEEARLYLRLKEDYALNNSEIAKQASKSSMHVGNALLLLEAPSELLEYIERKVVSATTIIDQLKRDDNGLVTLDKVQKAIKASQGKKVTNKTLKGFNDPIEPSFREKMEASTNTDNLIEPREDNTKYPASQPDPTEQDDFQELTSHATVNYQPNLTFTDEIESTLQEAIEGLCSNQDLLSKAVTKALTGVYDYYRGDIDRTKFLNIIEGGLV